MRAKRSANTALGRLGDGDDVGRAIAALLPDDSDG